MKKLLITILLVLLSIPAFSIGFEADVYFGESSGFDAGIVFGSGKVSNSFGVLYDTHDYEGKEEVEESFTNQYGNYLYTDYRTVDKPFKGTANDYGAYYKFDFAPNFVNLGRIKIGMDIGALVAATNESGLLVAIIPAAKVSIGKLEITSGYRGTFYMADVQEYTTSPFRSAFSIGGRYRFNGKNESKLLDYIDSSSNPFVIKHDKIY